MDPRQQQDRTEGELPWRRIGWIIFFCMIVLMIAVNAMWRDVGYKTQIERVRQAEELMTNGPKPAPAKTGATADAAKPFSPEEAEREMAERERGVREKFEADMNKRDDENRRKMERTNRDFERERRREAAELRARQASRIP